MKIDYDVKMEIDDYSLRTEYTVYGYVNGNFYGILGQAATLADAHLIGKEFKPNSNDARIQ